VFICGAYRGNKKGLWFVGVILAGLMFAVYITGEALHWDEVGFAVPWHTSEFLQAIHMADFFGYNFADLLAIPTATMKLIQLYGLHVGILPVLLILAMIVHFYLIKEKGISSPFWRKVSGEKRPFSKHVKIWFLWSAIILGAIILIAAFVPRDAGMAPQLIPSSPFYGMHKGPGALGVKPTFPISWTHGMNVFVHEHLGIEPDIWGTVVGMTLMICALIFVPFVDRSEREPASFMEAFAWKTRKWAFLLIALYWTVFLIGVVQNALAGPG
jgi:quinol-cytochrome oxidoreductase complex cytochrome b subunit